VKIILLKGNRLKENLYTAKAIMKPLGLGYQKVDMCLNFCMLYYDEDENFTKYKTCGHAQYKLNTSKEMTLIAYKKLRYFPITPRLQRLFMSLKTVEQMT
jgi:hypothetical protein